MILRGIDFGNVFCASGSRNFHGEGWWYHRLLRWMGLDYKGSTLITKTTTLTYRAGNLPLQENLQPQEFLPDCIKVDWMKGTVLNAVGLSGPGAVRLLHEGMWRAIHEPFIISFMSVGLDRWIRMEELQGFVKLLRNELPEFKAPVGLQVNISCPNVGLDPRELLEEVEDVVDVASDLGIPVILKINATFSPEAIVAIQNEPFDAISISNTIPWGKMADRINWERLFGTTSSPLAVYGGGGLSGAPLLPIVSDWVKKARDLGFRKPIMGGGGILSKKDADLILDAGATAIELGSVSILRPWRIRSIIRHVNSRLKGV